MTNKSRILRIGYADYMGRILTHEAAEQMVKDVNTEQLMYSPAGKVSRLYIEGDYVVAEIDT